MALRIVGLQDSVVLHVQRAVAKHWKDTRWLFIVQVVGNVVSCMRCVYVAAWVWVD